MSECGGLDVLGVRRPEPGHAARDSIELLAPLLVAAEGVEARTGGRKEESVPGPRCGESYGDGSLEVAHALVLHPRAGEVFGDLLPSLSEHDDSAR